MEGMQQSLNMVKINYIEAYIHTLKLESKLASMGQLFIYTAFYHFFRATDEFLLDATM